MIRINLAAKENEKIKSLLDPREYALSMFSPDDSAGLQDACMAVKDTFTLLELEPGTCIINTLSSLSPATRLVCITEKLSNEMRAMLISAGVCDCICSADTHKAAEYLAALTIQGDVNNGTFAVLDRNSSHLRMISGIAGRFGYSVMQVETIDEFYSYISGSTPVMSLINIGTDLDFNRFIRESHASSIKKSPVVAYKDMGEGLFVHEVLNGLSKITKLILSPDELYRMLIDLLVKKCIITGASAFNHSIEYEKYRHYRGMTIPQIYYEIHPDPCGQESLISHNRSEVIMREIESLEKLLVLCEGIKWLAGHNSPMKTTCGAGA